MIKVSDFVIKFLVQQGIKDVFMVSGGGIIHLVESVGNNQDITYYCNHNEQATSYCAEGYARAKNGLSVCLVTTGPGSTNALSGVCGAWVDSIPVLVISGQVKRELIADYSKLRQIGEQEINIIDMVKPVTKYAVTVMNPEDIRYELEKAVHIATTGRPGPVWINIPVDVQGSSINENRLRLFKPEPVRVDKTLLEKQICEVIDILKSSKRPILLCGYGIRIAGARDLLKQLLNEVKIPVLLSFNGMDLLAEDHPLLVGKPGIVGQRRANFALQNADCVISIGSRINLKIVGYNYKQVAARAKKIIVDIDKAEPYKITMSPDLVIKADAKDFLEGFYNQIKLNGYSTSQKWLDACKNWKRKYPTITKEFFDDSKHVNSYVLYDKLSDLSAASDIVVSSNGLSAVCLYQAFKPKDGQIVFTNNGYGAMGYGLPAAIGVCIYSGLNRTICIEGDGSLNMNIQELQLLNHHKLQVKLFVLNNCGYTSIRLTQNNLFNGHYVGCDENSGVSNPNYKKLAESFNLKYIRINNNNELEDKVKEALNTDGPVFCEINISPEQGIIPKTTSYKREDGTIESKPLEDMYPFLSREELEENMSISKE